MPDTNETREQILARIALATQNFNTYKDNYNDALYGPRETVSQAVERAFKWAESDEEIIIPEPAPGEHHYSAKYWANSLNEQGLRLNYLLETLPVVPDLPKGPGYEDIVSNRNVDAYLKQNSHPIAFVAEGKVFLSRVPWARKDSSGTILNNGSAIASLLGVPVKLMDNKNSITGLPLAHACSTDTVLGADDYTGKERVFFWQRCNYITDLFGVKHITAIEGATVHNNKEGDDRAVFTPEKNTGVFGPKFWCVCALDLGKAQDGSWLTHNGNKPNVHFGLPWLDTQEPSEGDAGVPLYQIWGISDVSFDDLSEDRKLELALHGIHGPTKDTWDDIVAHYSQQYVDALLERDIYTLDSDGNYVLTGGYRLNLWSECMWWNKDANDGNGAWEERPYWIHSAYMGGYNVGQHGAEVVSIINKPPYNNVSQNVLVNKRYQYTPPGVMDDAKAKHEGARVLAFGVLFDIVKNATKHSQGIHQGMNSNNNNATSPTHGTYLAGYIFPVATGNFLVGGTVKLGVNKVNYDYLVPSNPVSKKNRYGRILAIRTETFATDLIDSDTGEPIYVTTNCLVIDRNTCDPFFVRTTEAGAAELGEDVDVCCYATFGPAMAGETYAGGSEGKGVLGKHDGYVGPAASARHPYRVLGTEYSTGHLMLCPEMIALKGQLDKNITMADGSSYTVKSSDYVYLYAPPNVARKTSFNWTTFDTAGYIPVGVTPYQANNYTMNGWMDTVWGITYPVLQGSSSSHGHQDYFYQGGNPGEFSVGCALGPTAYWGGGAYGGSLYVNVSYALSTTYWFFGSRD